MTKIFQIFIMICYSFHFCHFGSLPAAQQAEQTLITSLLSGYNKNIRPDTVVYIDINAEILQIISIDEKQQIMTSSSYISQTWQDDRLSWTPNSTFNNVTVVMLPVKSIWIPDTMILTSADTVGYLTISDYSLASVDSSGSVFMILPALTIKTRCYLMVRKFPFDAQICSINLTSWAQGANRLAYSENKSEVVDIRKYLEHPLWSLKATDLIIIKAEDRVPSEESYNDIISIQLYLQRKPLFFIMNGIFACLILNCVTLLSYTLPFGTQIGLCMTCFMTYSVYSLNFSNLFPQQSEYIMLITLYFLFSIVWTALSMLWFVICNHYTSKAELPELLDKFCIFLQKGFFCCFPAGKDDKKSDKKNEDSVESGGNKNLDEAKIKNETNPESANCTSCREVFSSCCRRQTRVGIDDKHRDSVNELKGVQLGSKGISPEEITTPVTDKETDDKCNFCRRCETCQTEFDKDKAKGKNKKDIEAKCSALNYFVFLFILLFMFISNLALWLVMSQ